MPKLNIPVPQWEVAASRICLPSGLFVHIVERPAAGVVAITTVVGGGHSAEDDATRGAAHLVEHLWYRSRPGRGPRVDERWAGVTMDGWTTDDATLYFTVGAPADLAGLLKLEAERLRDPLQGIDAADVAREKEIVESELLWRGDHSVRAAGRYLAQGLWPEGHPYAASLTSVEQSNDLELPALRALVERTHRPENVVLRIEGAVDPQQVQDALLAALPPSYLDGDVASCGRDRETSPPPPPASQAVARIEAPVVATSLHIAWSLPAAFGPEEPYFRMAEDYLADVIVDPLSRLSGVGLVVARRLGAACRYDPGRYASTMTCVVDLPNEAVAASAWAAIRNRLADPWETERSDPIARAASREYLDAFTALDSFETWALGRRGFASFLGVVDPTPPLADSFLRREPTTVPELARKWLGPDRAVAAVLVPAIAQSERKAAPDITVRLDAPRAPEWHPRPRAIQVDEGTLENGLPVWSVRRNDVAYVGYTSLVSSGGWATTPFPGADEAMDRLEVYELPISLYEIEQSVAVAYGSDAGPTFRMIATRSPAESLRTALWIQAGLFTQLDMDFSARQPTLDRAVEIAFDAFLQVPLTTSASLRSQWLLPGDPAGAPWWERIRATRSVRENDVRAWQRSVYSPQNSVLVVAAPLEASRVRSDAAAMLGGWKGAKKQVPPVSPPLPPAPPRQTWLMAWEGAEVTEVLTTCRLPGRDDAHAPGLLVLEELLDHGAWQNLRGQLGLYGFGVYVGPVDPRVSLLTMRATTPPALAGPVLATFHGIVAATAAGLDERTVEWARQRAQARWARAVASAVGTYSLLVEAAQEGRTAAAVKRMSEDIAKVDAASLQALVADCAGHEASTVIGPWFEGVPGDPVRWSERAAALVDSLR